MAWSLHGDLENLLINILFLKWWFTKLPIGGNKVTSIFFVDACFISLSLIWFFTIVNPIALLISSKMSMLVLSNYSISCASSWIYAKCFLASFISTSNSTISCVVSSTCFFSCKYASWTCSMLIICTIYYSWSYSSLICSSTSYLWMCWYSF